MIGFRLRAPGFRPATLLASLTLLVVPALSRDVVAQPLPPELTQPVNDFAHVIDPASAAEMDREIRALKADSGDVVVVATIDTFAPYADINEYAVKMFENHGRGIGDRGKDNGLLVVLAVNDRRVKVEVGYDLEQFVTDGFAGEVSRTVMAPAFVRGEYGPGLQAGVQRIIARIAQSRAAPPRGRSELSSYLGLIIFFIIVMVVFSQWTRAALNPRRRWGGGPWSGWNSGVGSFGGGGGFGGGGFGGGFGGFGGGRSGGGGGGAGW